MYTDFIVHMGGGAYLNSKGEITFSAPDHAQIYQAPAGFAFDVEKAKDVFKDLTDLLPHDDEGKKKWEDWGVPKGLVELLSKASGVVGVVATALSVYMVLFNVMLTIIGQMERQHAPLIRDLSIGGLSPFLWPVSDYSGGRGVGWAISTRYFSNMIWQSDFNNDMRNSNYNFVRTFTYNDPSKADFYGKTISTESPPPGVTVPSRAIYAYQSKCTTPDKHPDGLFRIKADCF